jgi:hypothetical protein
LFKLSSLDLLGSLRKDGVPLIFSLGLVFDAGRYVLPPLADSQLDWGLIFQEKLLTGGFAVVVLARPAICSVDCWLQCCV